MSVLIIQILAASMLLATPLLLAAIGELVVEKSGVINLGVEGMMLIGGLAGFIALYQLQTSICTLELDGVCFASDTSVNQLQYLGALLVAAVVGAGAAAVFGFLTQHFRANHIAAGLGLTVLGAGLSNSLGGNFFGVDYTAAIVAKVPALFPGSWGDVPVLGPLLFASAVQSACVFPRHDGTPGMAVRNININNDSNTTTTTTTTVCCVCVCSSRPLGRTIRA